MDTGLRELPYQTLKYYGFLFPDLFMPVLPAVAYVKYDKASSAAAAIEALHETVLNDGRGPMLKVMMAEAPTR